MLSDLRELLVRCGDTNAFVSDVRNNWHNHNRDISEQNIECIQLYDQKRIEIHQQAMQNSEHPEMKALEPINWNADEF